MRASEPHAEALSSPVAAKYQYPFAAAPDIIRSNQKDAYFEGILLENLSDVIRKLYGARSSHKYTSEARALSELLYLGCTTLLGNRTLGEEYCDIVQVEENTLRLPSIHRRALYIISTVVLPYFLSKTLPSFRSHVRLKLESSLSQGHGSGTHIPHTSISQHVQSYILSNLSTLTSPSSFYAIGLSIFYFTGAYYHVGKRILGLRYLFTKRLDPSGQRVGYEVLGVLLVVQMAVQSWLHFHSTMRDSQPIPVSVGTISGGGAVTDGGIEVVVEPRKHDGNRAFFLDDVFAGREVRSGRLGSQTHTPVLSQPRYALTNLGTMNWLEGPQQRKCTLCLEELKDPGVTTCGHVFCWSCIADWIKEKPECPLCRQSVLSQHVLPLRG